MAWTAPTDRTTGYVVSAADWNVVEDNLTFLYGDTAWTAVTFAGTWVNFGAPYNTAAYRKIGTVVWVRGEIKSGTINTVAFTLPVGYRPLANLLVATASNSLFGQILVDSSGGVTPAVGSNVAFSVNCQFDTI